MQSCFLQKVSSLDSWTSLNDLVTLRFSEWNHFQMAQCSPTDVGFG